ncbi:MAG: OsmC family protein [Bacteroidota bacterium]|nr:OsmC family protein [Bacteroidota bacterium]
MSTSKVYYKGELRTEAIHILSGKSIMTDAPLDNHGKGEAFSPTDLTATSLANCMTTMMAIGAEGRGISIVKMETDVKKAMSSNPRRISEIIVNMTIKIEPDTESNREILEAIGLNCPVAKSLHPEIQQNVSFIYE